MRLTLEIYTEVHDDQLREAVDVLPSFDSDFREKKFAVIEGGNRSVVESLWNKTEAAQ